MLNFSCGMTKQLFLPKVNRVEDFIKAQLVTCVSRGFWYYNLTLCNHEK